MSNDLIWRMVRASDVSQDEVEAMRAAILWLAENVTDEMTDAADYELCSDDSFVTKEVIAAALRKAVGK